MRNNYFTIKKRQKKIEFDFYRRNALCEGILILKEFVEHNEYNWKKVCVLTALIYLNIAPLHHYPYSHLLYYLGKTMLYDILKNNTLLGQGVNHECYC